MDRAPFRAAVRLNQLAEFYWSQIDADNIHVDLLALPVHRYMNVIHTWILRRLDEDGQMNLDDQLNELFEWEKRAPIVLADSSGDNEIALMRAAMMGD